MNFRDQWVTDDQGNKFIFTVEMQRQLSEAGLPVEPASLALMESPKGAKRKRKDAPAHQPREATMEIPNTIQIDPETGKYIGRVKWYDDTKGYGFIARGGGEDIFFHKTDVQCDPKQLEQGAEILYDVEETDKGFEASEIELYDSDY